MWGWHVEAPGWCTCEGKSPLGNGKQVGLAHDPLRGLEAQKEAKTHTWGVDCWVYTCEWSPTLGTCRDSRCFWFLGTYFRSKVNQMVIKLNAMSILSLKPLNFTKFGLCVCLNFVEVEDRAIWLSQCKSSLNDGKKIFKKNVRYRSTDCVFALPSMERLVIYPLFFSFFFNSSCSFIYLAHFQASLSSIFVSFNVCSVHLLVGFLNFHHPWRFIPSYFSLQVLRWDSSMLWLQIWWYNLECNSNDLNAKFRICMPIGSYHYIHYLFINITIVLDHLSV